MTTTATVLVDATPAEVARYHADRWSQSWDRETRDGLRARWNAAERRAYARGRLVAADEVARD